MHGSAWKEGLGSRIVRELTGYIITRLMLHEYTKESMLH
jgi:hypothetical protein